MTSIGITASFTTGPLADGIRSLGHQVYEADYNQIHTTCLDPFASFGADVGIVVVLWRIEDVFELDLLAMLNGDDTAAQRIVDQCRELAALVVSMADATGKSVVLGLPPAPVGLGVDPLDTTTSTTLSRLIGTVRDLLVDAAATHPAIRLYDHGRAVDVLGAASAHDLRNQLLYRQPYRTAAIAALTAGVDAVVASFTTPSPKVLVLDADNTLWGGVVGEDGVSGIQIGDSFPGNAFRSFQISIKQLERRGVMLAIASKNDADLVDEVFTQRSEMILRPDDITAWRVNWQPKSANIIEIADELNIGLDSIVFVDDSSFEVAEVRNALPTVRVLQAPEDPEDLPELLNDTGWFRNMQPTDEDRGRTAMMVTQRSRNAAASTAMSQEDFLASLQIEVSVARDDTATLGRLTQLVNKTNQFNLTTIRRTETEVAGLISSPSHGVYTFSVSDKFGSYGLVGVAIVDRLDPRDHRIDTLLMSCRVLKRQIETAILQHLCAESHDAGAERLIGQYVPTAKNSQVATLYSEHGFELIGHDTFAQQLPGGVTQPRHITVIHA